MNTVARILQSLFCLVVLVGCAAGNAERAAIGFLPESATGRGFTTEHLYTCTDPSDPAHYFNVFKMSNGRMISINLVAQGKEGMFVEDKVGVVDLTDCPRIRGIELAIGEPHENLDIDFDHINMFSFAVAYTRQGNDTLVQVKDLHGPTAIISLNKLARLRAGKAASRYEPIGDEAYFVAGGQGKQSSFLYFPASAVKASQNANANRYETAPRYVIYAAEAQGLRAVMLGDAFPIADTGYSATNPRGEVVRTGDLKAVPRSKEPAISLAMAAIAGTYEAVDNSLCRSIFKHDLAPEVTLYRGGTYFGPFFMDFGDVIDLSTSGFTLKDDVDRTRDVHFHIRQDRPHSIFMQWGNAELEFKRTEQ